MSGLIFQQSRIREQTNTPVMAYHSRSLSEQYVIHSVQIGRQADQAGRVEAHAGQGEDEGVAQPQQLQHLVTKPPRAGGGGVDLYKRVQSCSILHFVFF
jgi:hypothetical protein